SAYFSDLDGDTLTYTADSLPAGLSIDATTGEISGTIDNSASQGGASGVYTVTVTASDAYGGSVDQTFEWTVTNPVPEALPDEGSVTEDGPDLVVSAADGVINSASAAAGADNDPDLDAL